MMTFEFFVGLLGAIGVAGFFVGLVAIRWTSKPIDTSSNQNAAWEDSSHWQWPEWYHRVAWVIVALMFAPGVYAVWAGV